MRLPVLFLAVAFFASTAFAQWHIAAREKLPASPGVAFEQIDVASDTDSVSLHAVTAQNALDTFAVIDDPEGSLSVATAGAGRGALATVNGGYFSPEHVPLGLVLAKGQILHPLQHAPLLSGLVLAGPKRDALLRVAEYKPSPAHREALQAGPFLIDGGRPVAGLNATRSAARTIVFFAKDGEFGFLLLRSASLADTAQILALPQLIPGHPIIRALNLDGGSSSGLWVRRPGVPYYSPEFKTVRTYLSIVPR